MTLEIQSISDSKLADGFEAVSSHLPMAVMQEINTTLSSLITASSTSERTMAAPRKMRAAVLQEMHDPRNHYLNSYSFFDQNVELEDGSFWSIRSSDMYKVLNWAQDDTLSICPNKRIFGSRYLIQNHVTGEIVEADLIVGPLAFGAYTHWIIAIDPWLHRIYLEDGSAWTVRGLDSISNWAINDTLIVGDGRNEWLGHHDSILINVNLDKHVYANRGA